jgi:uncharacterized protein with HEPN domain
MRRDDRIRLQHMLDSAREALSFANGHSRADLDANRMLALSLVKCIEIVGEAATRVGEETRQQFFTGPLAGHRRHAEPSDPRLLRH